MASWRRMPSARFVEVVLELGRRARPAPAGGAGRDPAAGRRIRDERRLRRRGSERQRVRRRPRASRGGGAGVGVGKRDRLERERRRRRRGLELPRRARQPVSRTRGLPSSMRSRRRGARPVTMPGEEEKRRPAFAISYSWSIAGMPGATICWSSHTSQFVSRMQPWTLASFRSREGSACRGSRSAASRGRSTRRPTGLFGPGGSVVFSSSALRVPEEVRVVVELGVSGDALDLPVADRKGIVLAADRRRIPGEDPPLRVVRGDGAVRLRHDDSRGLSRRRAATLFGTTILTPASSNETPGLSSLRSAGLAGTSRRAPRAPRRSPAAGSFAFSIMSSGIGDERSRDVLRGDRRLDERGDRVGSRARCHVSASTTPVSGRPRAFWKAATALRMVVPERPSISPGEKCARARRICARRTAAPRASGARRAVARLEVVDRGGVERDGGRSRPGAGPFLARRCAGRASASAQEFPREPAGGVSRSVVLQERCRNGALSPLSS